MADPANQTPLDATLAGGGCAIDDRSVSPAGLSPRLRGLTSRLDALPGVGIFLVVVVPLFALFFATSSRGSSYNIDAFSNIVPAWSLATRGTIYLDEYVEFTAPEYWKSVGWFVAVGDTAVGKYPPGAALWAAPLYAVSPHDAELRVVRPSNRRPEFDTVEILVPPLWPAAAAAALSVALALGFLALTSTSLVSRSRAVGAAYVAGLGTSAWGVASDTLWQHGPAMMWLTLGALLVSRQRLAASGLAYGMSVLTRPPTAIIGLGTSLGAAGGGEGRVARWLRLSFGVGLGLLALVTYNAVVFGSPSLSGGYESTLLNNVLAPDLGAYPANVAGAFFDPARGILVWSPFLAVLAVGLPAAWRSAPSWVRGAAVGSLGYLLLHLVANEFEGGSGFLGYRYPLEPLAAGAPLLVVAYREWVARTRSRTILFRLTVAIAIGMQVASALR